MVQAVNDSTTAVALTIDLNTQLCKELSSVVLGFGVMLPRGLRGLRMRRVCASRPSSSTSTVSASDIASSTS